jgi:hypothetical protein
MSRPRLDLGDENQLTDDDHDEPALSADQYTDDDGTQVHEVRAVDEEGNLEALEYSERYQDGSSSRGLIQNSEDGSSYEREVEMDRSGRVKSIREEKKDEWGDLTSGRYDDDGDGRIDRELRDIDGDGELDEVPVHNRRGKASQFDFKAKGEWDVDADGDGDTDWQSDVQANRSGVDHRVDVFDDGDVVAHDDSHMDRRGSRRDLDLDTDGDGDFDEREVRFNRR